MAEDKEWILTYALAAMSLPRTIAALSAALCSAACGDDYVPKPLTPYWPTEGWRTADPRDAGLEKDKLDDLVDRIRNRDWGVDALVVARHGYIVVEEYFQGYGGEPHPIYSCTKSIVSTLVGQLYDDSAVDDLDAGLLALFPGRELQNLDTRKRNVTLEDLLTMRAGFDARDSYLYGWEGLEALHQAEDAIQYVLDLPMAEEPGVRFEYTNGVSHLLSGLITEITGAPARHQAEERLFGPLGINGVSWDTDSRGRNWGYATIDLRPRQMAKIGHLFAMQGEWDGTQIVSRDWWERATAKATAATIVDGYGYQWWVDSSGYFLALGYRGQFIFVSPQHQLVAVYLSSEEAAFERALPTFEAEILKAIR